MRTKPLLRNRVGHHESQVDSWSAGDDRRGGRDVIGAVMLEDWIVPAGVRRPRQDRMIREITMMVTHGITGRPS